MYFDTIKFLYCHEKRTLLANSNKSILMYKRQMVNLLKKSDFALDIFKSEKYQNSRGSATLQLYSKKHQITWLIKEMYNELYLLPNILKIYTKSPQFWSIWSECHHSIHFLSEFFCTIQKQNCGRNSKQKKMSKIFTINNEISSWIRVQRENTFSENIRKYENELQSRR